MRRSDCDTIFIVANFQPNKNDPMNAINDEHALMRFEFIEAVSRLAIAKYGKVGVGSPALLQRSIFTRVLLLAAHPLWCSGRPLRQACIWHLLPAHQAPLRTVGLAAALHSAPAADSFTAGLPHRHLLACTASQHKTCIAMSAGTGDRRHR